MSHWKWRLSAFMTSFVIGLLLFLFVSFVIGLLRSPHRTAPSREQMAKHTCGGNDSNYFSSPEEVLVALKNEEVLVRREVFRRLFLRPGIATTYYDYERDRDYPERADRAELKYLNLDDEKNNEAVLTFVRYENPVGLILKRENCGWRLVGALSAWLRFEDYPYKGWLELPETVKTGVHEILVRESTGDATHYARNARLLKLMDGGLSQIAEFAEESIKPVEDYSGPDWSDVKAHEATRYTFITQSNGQAARLHLETQEEVVKYSGAPSAHTFWFETDGAWHSSKSQWRTRPAARLRLLNKRSRELVWDEQSKRFVVPRNERQA